MCVVIHLESYARIEADLSAIAACLSQSLSSVTQLSIQLRGEDAHGAARNPLVRAAAAAVRVLGPLCGPLTHITVSGEVRVWGENTYTRLLRAASAVCAPSLTHFSFSMQARLPTAQLQLQLGGGQEDKVLECGCDFLIDVTACTALRSLTRLTHLRLERGSLCDGEAWAALPSSLQSLDMCSPYCSLPQHLLPLPHPSLLPSLHSLSLLSCGCHRLVQLLRACPKLQQLKLVELRSPDCASEQQDLRDILVHPMAAFPVLPTVTDVCFDFANKRPCQFLPAHPLKLLHHIPRAIPNLEVLRLDNVLLLDSDLTQLDGCASLRKLRLNYSDHVTGAALLRLATALPSLMGVQVFLCKLVTPEHSQAIVQLMHERGSAEGDQCVRTMFGTQYSAQG
ncbi:MAG: hypothetical protein WDW36_007328 [Sanguina aurantia]